MEKNNSESDGSLASVVILQESLSIVEDTNQGFVESPPAGGILNQLNEALSSTKVEHSDDIFCAICLNHDNQLKQALIKCDKCKYWNHYKCIKVPEIFGVMAAASEKAWLCNFCREGSAKFLESDILILENFFKNHEKVLTSGTNKVVSGIVFSAMMREYLDLVMKFVTDEGEAGQTILDEDDMDKIKKENEDLKKENFELKAKISINELKSQMLDKMIEKELNEKFRAAGVQEQDTQDSSE